jgi:hypothetical protein
MGLYSGMIEPCPKYKTRVEVIESGKDSSLLRYSYNYCQKRFYSTGLLFREKRTSFMGFPGLEVPE